MGGRPYFDSEGGGVPSAPGRFATVSDIPSIEMLPGLAFQPVLGERTLTSFVRFKPRTAAPVHAHEEEQVVVILEGELEFSLAGEVRTMRPGDVAIIPAWVPHGARTRDHGCYELDVFSPPRRALLAFVESPVGAAVSSDEKA